MKLTTVLDPDRIRATFDEGDGLCIEISHPTNVAVLGLILGQSIVGVGTLITLGFLMLRFVDFVRSHNPAAFKPNTAILSVLLVTLITIICCCYTYYYTLRRREVIQIDGYDLRLAWHGFLVQHRRTRVFPLKYVKNLRFSPLFSSGGNNYPHTSRSIAFDYHGSTVHFGFGVPEKESRHSSRRSRTATRSPTTWRKHCPWSRSESSIEGTGSFSICWTFFVLEYTPGRAVQRTPQFLQTLPDDPADRFPAQVQPLADHFKRMALGEV